MPPLYCIAVRDCLGKFGRGGGNTRKTMEVASNLGCLFSIAAQALRIDKGMSAHLDSIQFNDNEII